MPSFCQFTFIPTENNFILLNLQVTSQVCQHLTVKSPVCRPREKELQWMWMRKLLLYCSLSGNGRCHPCEVWPGQAVSLECTSKGGINETGPCCFYLCLLFPWRLRRTTELGNPNPRVSTTDSTMANLAKTQAQALWKNSIRTVFSQRKLKSLPKALQLKSPSMWTGVMRSVASCPAVFAATWLS